ncbi:MAG: galactose-1-phosphate uridylyltransferase [Ktedonobacterales bacterium]|nr:galactose-1-phosphate uridylyltransferase [Ktedonobacterales bacterium]
MSETAEQVPGQRLIRNPLLGTVVVQTPGRMNRREGATECPFCAAVARGEWPAGAATWARPNDFPPLRPPVGECYVLLYAREHHLSFVDLGTTQVAEIVDLWQQVYLDLSARYACVMTFENAGAAIGQTQSHPHGQTYGVAFLPPTIDREMAEIAAAHDHDGACLLCQILAEEAVGPRVVIDTPHWLGFVPQWARYPYEVHLYSRTHVANIGALPRGGDATQELASALLRVVRAYNSVFEAPMPYMLALHQLGDPRYHFHIELLPVGRAPGKLKFAASSESAFGLWLNDAVPDAKAAELRAAMA